MHLQRIFLSTVILVFFGAVPGTRAQSNDEDHKFSVMGIEVGMNAQQVLDHLKRNADAAKDEKDHTFLTWKLPDGNLLKIDFWKEHVAGIRLTYKNPRPATDLWLAPLPLPARITPRMRETPLNAADPRWQRDYKVTEPADQLRIIWLRDEKTREGYHLRIAFWSASKKELGSRFGEYVEYKDVFVAPDDMPLFAQSIQSGAIR